MSRPSKLNGLFKPTEPAPVQEQQPTTAELNVSDPLPGMESYVSESQPEKKQGKPKPQSVYLTKTELAYIQEIAEHYGESRHSVMQFAVKELIREWRKKGQLRTNILGKLDK